MRVAGCHIDGAQILSLMRGVPTSGLDDGDCCIAGPQSALAIVRYTGVAGQWRRVWHSATALVDGVPRAVQAEDALDRAAPATVLIATLSGSDDLTLDLVTRA